MVGLIRGARHLASIQVGYQRPIAGFGQPVGCFLDLIVDTPPLLDHHKARHGCILCGCCQIAGTGLSVRPLELYRLSHSIPPLDSKCAIHTTPRNDKLIPSEPFTSKRIEILDQEKRLATKTEKTKKDKKKSDKPRETASESLAGI